MVDSERSIDCNIEERHCYVDVLAASLGQTESKYFTANPNQWAQTVHEARQTTRDRFPQLLKGVQFDLYCNHGLWSDQVEIFLRLMRDGQTIKLSSSFYTYEIEDEAKCRVFQEHMPFLEGYEEGVDELTGLLDRRLGVNRQV